MKNSTQTIVVNEGDQIPFNGKVVEGLALVDESAVAGVSTAVLIDGEAGRDRVCQGSVIASGWLKITGTP